MRYKVNSQFQGGREIQMNEAFANQAEAKSFIESKLQEDAQMNLQVTYKIMEFGDPIATFPPLEKDLMSPVASDSGGRNSSSSITNPFSTRPVPKGVKALDHDEDKDN